MITNPNLTGIVDYLNNAAVGLGRTAEEVQSLTGWVDTMRSIVNMQDTRINELENYIEQERKYKTMLATAMKGLFELYE